MAAPSSFQPASSHFHLPGLCVHTPSGVDRGHTFLPAIRSCHDPVSSAALCFTEQEARVKVEAEYRRKLMGFNPDGPSRDERMQRRIQIEATGLPDYSQLETGPVSTQKVASGMNLPLCVV